MSQAVQDVGASLGLAQSQSAVPNKNVFGKEDFLRLLIEQMKAQDPLNPQDPAQFTAQLAQFSSLEQLYNLGDALNGIASLSASLNNTSVASFLGREVTSDGNTFAVKDGQASAMHFNLGAPATSVNIKIYNSSGTLVNTVPLGAQGQGDGQYLWDGALAAGGSAPDGTYTFAVEATGLEGQSIPAETFVSGKVTGLVYENGNTWLDMDGQRISIADIRSVRLLD